MKPHIAVVRAGFAAEHKDSESATMEGALASGIRAARQVMETISEQRI